MRAVEQTAPRQEGARSTPSSFPSLILATDSIFWAARSALRLLSSIFFFFPSFFLPRTWRLRSGEMIRLFVIFYLYPATPEGGRGRMRTGAWWGSRAQRAMRADPGRARLRLLSRLFLSIVLFFCSLLSFLLFTFIFCSAD